MKTQHAFGLLALLCFAGGALSLTGCSRRDAGTSASKPGEKIYPVQGITRSVGEGTITVAHEDVPGLMPAMTMPFEARDRRDLGGLRAGDAVQFQLHAAGENWWISNVRKINAAELSPSRSATPGPGVEAVPAAAQRRLKEGDPAPDFSLIDQKKQPLTRETFKDKALLLTFVFTRCPMPNYCPHVSTQFSKIQKAVQSDTGLAEKARLLSITLDPTFDTPEVLANYGVYFEADGEVWRFGGGKAEEIKKLTTAFSVYVQPENGTINHGLCTALVRPDGVIRKIWRGNAWTTDEVLKEMRRL